MCLNGSILIIQLLVVFCLLLGLMGMVIGMIEVFDVMVIVGLGNVCLMVLGVLKVIIFIMVGMVGVFLGVFVVIWLICMVKLECMYFEDVLII